MSLKRLKRMDVLSDRLARKLYAFGYYIFKEPPAQNWCSDDSWIRHIKAGRGFLNPWPQPKYQ